TTVDELLPVLAAASSDLLTLAVFVTLGTAAAPTVTVNVIAGAEAPAAMVFPAGRVQVTACPTALQAVHPVPVPETKVSPAGKVSVTVITLVLVVARPPVLLTTM